MSRSNREGQSNRSRSGIRWEDTVEPWLREVLDLAPEGKYELKHFTRMAKEFKRIKYWPKPDYGIRRTVDGEWVFFVGCKASLRERWTIDDRHAGVMKECYPNCVYVEATADDDADFTRCDRQRRWLDGVFNNRTKKDFTRLLRSLLV
jgi:hypothetical protein